MKYIGFIILLIISSQTRYVYQFTTNVDANIPEELADPERTIDSIRMYMAVSYIAKLASKLSGEGAAALQRRILESLAPSDKFYIYENMIVKDEIINSVKVRTYRPIGTENVSLPALIFYHGGGYTFSSIEAYDYYIYNLAKEVKMMAISVDYRLAPEHPFPIPLNDCLKVTNYVIENPNKFGINKYKVILSGDSAGGHVAAVVTQKLSKMYAGMNIPKAQVLIYPLLQMFNMRLPSKLYYDIYYKYYNKEKDTLSSFEANYWIMGITNVTQEMQDVMEFNYHTLLMDDSKLRNQYMNYLNLSLIPDEYKINKTYYTLGDSMYPSHLEETNILQTNKVLASRLKELFSIDYSPSLADDTVLQKLPISYFIICEMDMFKDENIIYAERLKRNGVDVQIKFYRDGAHGMFAFSFAEPALRMFTDLVEFIKNNI